MTDRPSHLYDREVEWRDLMSFSRSSGAKLRIGVVYGRRRFGKSYLLRRLVEEIGGLYYLALEEARGPALHRFAGEVGRLYTPPASLAFESWESALGQALDLLGSRARPQVLILDEYPYLRAQSPELDSAVQALADEVANGRLGAGWQNPVSLVLCGSALSVMTELLSGTSPLRGRASLDMPVASFDYRQAREYWGVDDANVALGLHSIVGGAAGYKDLASNTLVPESEEALTAWLGATVFNPSHALFREDEYLLREDPRVTKEALYYSILSAIAEGATSQSRMAAVIGKRSDELNYALAVLVSAGFVTRDEDLLVRRSPVYRIADPIVRFHKLITRRHQAALEDRKSADVWRLAQPTYLSQVVGPHFESVCRRWTEAYASTSTLGAEIGPVRTLQVNDAETREKHQVDAVAATMASSGSRRKTIQVLGEAKGTMRPRALGDLNRLDRIQALLKARKGVSVAKGAKKLIFGMQGFESALIEATRSRKDVELVDLERLYAGD